MCLLQDSGLVFGPIAQVLPEWGKFSNVFLLKQEGTGPSLPQITPLKFWNITWKARICNLSLWKENLSFSSCAARDNKPGRACVCVFFSSRSERDFELASWVPCSLTWMPFCMLQVLYVEVTCGNLRTMQRHSACSQRCSSTGLNSGIKNNVSREAKEKQSLPSACQATCSIPRGYIWALVIKNHTEVLKIPATNFL